MTKSLSVWAGRNVSEFTATTDVLVRHQSTVMMVCVRDDRFGSKVGQLGPKWDKSGSFSDQISVHLARGAKCTEI